MTFKLFGYHILILKNRHHYRSINKSCQIRKSGDYLVLTDERGKHLPIQIDMIISDLNKPPSAVVSLYVDLNHIHEEPIPYNDYFDNVDKPNLSPHHPPRDRTPDNQIPPG